MSEFENDELQFEVYLSKEQICKMCHISKETVTRLILTGLLPAIKTEGGKGHYLVSKKNVEKYLLERSRYPAKYAQVRNSNVYTYGEYAEYRQDIGEKMVCLAGEQWKEYPDLLTRKMVTGLLGYGYKTLERWGREFNLKAIRISGKLFYSKEKLVEFVGSPEFHSMPTKSVEHIELLRRALYE